LKCGVQIKFSLHEGQRQELILPSSKHSRLLSRITDQLALGQRPKTLQQLINQTIELNNCYHKKIQSNKKTDPTPSTLGYKKKFPSKPFTPSASTLVPRSRKPTKIALVLNKEGQREREGICLYCGGKHELDSCVKRITCEAAKLAKK
ncbi:hypothetical protein VP01_13320g1, partial [Puccinia sorghi]